MVLDARFPQTYELHFDDMFCEVEAQFIYFENIGTLKFAQSTVHTFGLIWWAIPITNITMYRMHLFSLIRVIFFWS